MHNWSVNYSFEFEELDVCRTVYMFATLSVSELNILNALFQPISGILLMSRLPCPIGEKDLLLTRLVFSLLGCLEFPS